MTEPFVEPTSLAEAEERRLAVIADVQQIQAQLADRNKVAGGRRLTDVEYHTWRKRALVAMTCKQAELRLIKKWAKDYHLLYRPTVATDGERLTAENLAGIAGRAANNLRDYSMALEREVVALQQENAALRDLLPRDEPTETPTLAGHDHWRDET